MLARLPFFFAWAALVAGLILPTMTPELANVATLVLMGVGLFVLALLPASRVVLAQPAIRLSLLAGLVLLIALLPTAKSPMHVLVIFVLAPLWFAFAHAGLLTRLGRWLTPLTIASFALLGTAGGVAVAAYGALVLGLERGGFLVNNPIHLADLVLMLGFVALVGLLDKRPIRFLFLLGPVFAMVALWLTASRGPQVAFLPLLAFGGGTLVLMILPRKRAWLTIAGGVVLVAIAAALALASGLGGRLASTDFNAILQSGTSEDASIGERLFMYQSAWRALLASPIWGHGIIDFTQAAAQYVPESPYPPSQHLHSDLADFAVIGGGLGLLSYALLLAAPILGGFTARGPGRQAAIYLGIAASVGYFAMGLTNAMFGVLTQTVVYAVLLALVAVLALKDGNELQ